MNLAVIGGGSTYTPELVEGLVTMSQQLPLERLCLVDPDEARLRIVGGLAARMLQRAGHRATLVLTGRLEEAVEGADAVLVQLRVGGQAARTVDERLPLDFGCIGQETTGFGGLAKALRTVPVVLDVAELARRVSPRAWIVDFTNPVGIVTRALLDAGHEAVGLCSAAAVFQRHFARVLGVATADVELDHVGLNHLTWETAVRVAGREVLGELLDDEHVGAVAPATGLPAPLLQLIGAVPSYYLHYFYEHDRVLEHERSHPSRAEEVAAIEQRLLELYADERLAEKPALLERRGGACYSTAAVQLLAARFGTGAPTRHVVNLRNSASLPFLPPEAVVELPAEVGPSELSAVPVAPLDPLMRALVAHVSAYEELALEAALRGGRARVVRALLAHPLIGQADLADRLADELIGANQAYLSWA